MRIGIFGAGWIVEHAHLPVCKKCNIQVKVVVDQCEERAKYIANLFSVDKFGYSMDHFWILIDAVIVATPNYTHYELCKEALMHNKHVLCEKPVCLSCKEINELYLIAINKKLVFMPGFVNEFRQDILYTKEQISKNSVGEIISIDAGWIRSQGVPKPGSWFTNKKCSGGGVLVDLGPHILDIIDLFVGLQGECEPVYYKLFARNMRSSNIKPAKWMELNSSTVQHAITEVEDMAKIVIKYKNGIRSSCVLAWQSKLAGDITYFTVEGTKGVIHLFTLFGFSNNSLIETINYVERIHKHGNSNESIRKVAFAFDNIQMKAFESMMNEFSLLIRKGENLVFAKRAKKSVFTKGR